jgi:hypothetical protein
LNRGARDRTRGAKRGPFLQHGHAGERFGVRASVRDAQSSCQLYCVLQSRGGQNGLIADNTETAENLLVHLPALISRGFAE